MRPLYTISTTAAQVRYATDGVTTVFPVPFQFFEATTLRVRLVTNGVVETWTRNTHYTVSGGNGAAGSITALAVPAAGKQLLIDLAMPVSQQTVSLSPNGPLPATTVEQGFDRVVTIAKQLDQRIGSTPGMDTSFDPSVDARPVFPKPEPGYVLMGKNDRAGWLNVPPSDLPAYAGVIPPTPNPGVAVLTTPLRTMVSPPIVSPTAHTLYNVFQTPAASTISVQTKSKHGYSSGASVTMRVGGWNGASLRAHPANGTWPITVVDAYTFILTGSVWVADSMFRHGVAYTGTLIDARPELTALYNQAAADGGGIIELPPGVLAFLTKDTSVGPNTGLSILSHTVLAGTSEATTTIFAGDGLNAFVLQPTGASYWTIRDLEVLGNRQYQTDSAWQNIRVGQTGYITRGGRLQNFASRGSAGYGMGWQTGSFVDCVLENVTVDECDFDGYDFKDLSFQNYNNTVNGARVYHFGLNHIGVNFPSTALPANAFATTNGSSVVTVTTSAPHGLVTGMAVTFSGASLFNGVDPNRSARITGSTSTTITVDLGQIATGTGSGGGSSAVMFSSEYTPGAGFDFRGSGWNASNLHAEGDLQSRVGVRARPPGLPNGIGVLYSNFSNITVNNLGNPVTISNSTGIECDGINTTFRGVTVRNCDFGAYVSSTARQCSVLGLQVEGGRYGAWVDGQNIEVQGMVKSATVCAFWVDGRTPVQAKNVTIRGKSIESLVGFQTTSVADGTQFLGCESIGDTTTHIDGGTNTIWDSPQFARRARILSLPSAGTTNPTALVEKDLGKIVQSIEGASEQGVVSLPAPTARMVGGSITFFSRSTNGLKINTNGSTVRIVGTSAGTSSSVSTTTAHCSLTLTLVSGNTWLATAFSGTWASP